MREAGFEPAHPEIVGLKSTALDHSAIRAHIVTLSSQIFMVFHFWFKLYFGFVSLGSRTNLTFRETAHLPPFHNHYFSLSSFHAAASATVVSNKLARHIGQFIDVSHHVRKHFTQYKCPQTVKTWFDRNGSES